MGATVTVVSPDGESRSLQIASIRAGSKALLVRFDGIANKTQAEALTHATLWADASQLDPPTDDEFYAFQLEGLNAVDSSGSVIGEVRGLTDFGAGEILIVATRLHGEVMLPFADPYVGAVDLDAGTVDVQLDDFV